MLYRLYADASHGLTEREREAFDRLARGLDNTAIARRVFCRRRQLARSLAARGPRV